MWKGRFLLISVCTLIFSRKQKIRNLCTVAENFLVKITRKESQKTFFQNIQLGEKCLYLICTTFLRSAQCTFDFH